VSFNKFYQLTEDLAGGVHKWNVGGAGPNVLKLMLTNVAPIVTDSVKANLTEIAAGNGYVAGGTPMGNVDCQQVSGVAKLVGDDVIFTASGGPIGPFRYVVIYNDTPTSPADPLIGWWDYGSSVTLGNGLVFTVNLSQVDGILTIT
jgi:hypothetical protein